jgi:hypothetical protein
MQQMGFEQLDYGLLTEAYFLKVALFPTEISVHLMSFLIETHFAKQAGVDQQELTNASSSENLHRTTDVTTDG